MRKSIKLALVIIRCVIMETIFLFFHSFPFSTQDIHLSQNKEKERKMIMGWWGRCRNRLSELLQVTSDFHQWDVLPRLRRKRKPTLVGLTAFPREHTVTCAWLEGFVPCLLSISFGHFSSCLTASFHSVTILVSLTSFIPSTHRQKWIEPPSCSPHEIIPLHAHQTNQPTTQAKRYAARDML